MAVMEQFTWVPIALAVAVHVVLIGVAAWDLTAVATSHPDLSVSHLFQRWAIENPILPLALGIIVGHLFWPIR